MAAQNTSFKEKTFSALLMFIIGFAGVSLLGALILVALISLGVIPKI